MITIQIILFGASKVDQNIYSVNYNASFRYKYLENKDKVVQKNVSQGYH